MRRPLQRGFTLIELMVVVAIIGILASVAIPSFSRLQLRARSAERNVIMASVRKAIDEYYAREGRFPYDGGAFTFLDLQYDQPNTSPGPAKRMWRTASLGTLDHWNLLSMSVDGAVYYSYGGFAYVIGNTRVVQLYAYGDLDGDGAQNRWTKQWVYVDGVMQRYGGGNLPCPECTYGTETNGWTF